MAERPNYSSKNNKRIRTRLSQLLKENTNYRYNAANDSVYSDYRTGALDRSKIAAERTVNKAKGINNGDTYSERVASGSRHVFDAKLNGLVPQLEAVDYQKNQSERQNQFNKLNALLSKEQTEYGRYRDDVAEWQQKRKLELERQYAEKQKAEKAAAAQAKADAKAAKEAEKAAKAAAKAAKGRKSGGGDYTSNDTPAPLDEETPKPATEWTSAEYLYGRNPHMDHTSVQDSHLAQIGGQYQQSLVNSGKGYRTAQGKFSEDADPELFEKNTSQSRVQRAINVANKDGYINAQEMQDIYNTQRADMARPYVQGRQQAETDYKNALKDDIRPKNAEDYATRAYLANSSDELRAPYADRRQQAIRESGMSQFERGFEKKYNMRVSEDNIDEVIVNVDDKIAETQKKLDQANSALGTTDYTMKGGAETLQKAQKDAAQYEGEMMTLQREKSELKQGKLELLYGNYSDKDVDKLIEDAKAKRDKAYSIIGTTDYTMSGGSEKMQNAKMEADQADEELQELTKYRYNRKLSKASQEIENDPELKGIFENMGYYDASTGKGTKDSDMDYNARLAIARNQIKNLGYSKDEADFMLEAYIYGKDSQNAAISKQNATEYASKHPILASAKSIPQGIAGAGDAAGYFLNYAHNKITDDYRGYNFYNQGGQNRANANAAREQVSQDIANGPTGKAGAFLYQTGMSIADSIVQQQLFGPASTVIMGASAASDAARNAAEKGLSEDQVAATALVAGVAEWFFEKVELDQLDAFKSGKIKSWKTFGENLAKQAATEGFGEGMTDIANFTADQIINGYMSEFYDQVNGYMSEGMTFEEAKAKAGREQAKQVGLSALGGALSGVVMGSFYQTLGMAKTGNKLQNDVESVIEYGLDSAEGTEANTQANKALEKYGNDKKVGNIELAMLSQANAEVAQAEAVAEIEKTVKNTDAAEGLKKAAAGENITTAEAEAIKSDANARAFVESTTGIELTSESDTATVKVAAMVMEGASVRDQNTQNIEARNSSAAETMSKVDTSQISEKQTADITDAVRRISDRSNISDEEYQKKMGFSRQDVSSLKGMESAGPVSAKGAEVDVDGVPYTIKSVGNMGSVQLVSEAGNVETFPISKVSAVDPNVGEYLSAVENYGKNGVNAFAQGYRSSGLSLDAYTNAFNAFYDSGKTGLPIDYVRNINGEMLSDNVKVMAYMSGVNDQVKLDEKAEKKATEARVARNPENQKRGNVKVNENTSKRFSIETIDMIRDFAKQFNVNVEFFDSAMDSENGHYRAGTIYISNNSSNPAMVVAMHEYTHYMKQSAPAQYRAYRNEVINFLKRVDGEFYDSLAETIRDDYRAAGVKLTNDALMDEIAANATEAFVKNPDAWKEPIRRNKGFKDVVLGFLDNFGEYLKGESSKFEVKDAGAMMLSNVQSELKKAADLWSRGANVAAETGYVGDNAKSYSLSVQAENLGNDGAEVIDSKGNIIAYTEGEETNFNLNSEENVKKVREKYLKNALKKGWITEADAQDIRDGMDLATEITEKYADEYANFSNWQKATIDTIVNEKGKKVPVLTVEVANGEYKMNIDFSTVCKKRKALNAVLNAAVRMGLFNKLNLDERGIAIAQDIIKSHDLEVACRLCFVDAKRYRIKSWAESYTGMWNRIVSAAALNGEQISEFNFAKAVGRDEEHTLGDQLTDKQKKAIRDAAKNILKDDGTPKPIAQEMAALIISDPNMRHRINAGDLISSAGMMNLKYYPKLDTLINKHQGTAKPKTAYDESAYNSEVLGNTRRYTQAKAYSVGGVRIQSFSDYMGNMFFDYAQLVADLSARKLPAHSYTKELDFVRIFGKTGIKINMSLVPAVNVPSEIREYIEEYMTTKDGKYKEPTAEAKKDPRYARYLELRENAGLNDDGTYLWADETFRGSDKQMLEYFKKNGIKGDSLDIADYWQNLEGYSQNIGTIAVGVSNNHILKLLRDDRIRMVIPYHKSSINHVVAAMGNIDLYKDYTSVQNTRDSSGKKLDGVPDFDWYGHINAKDSKGNRKYTAKEVAQMYLEWCAAPERNYIPKFDEFKGEENYYKLLIDFASYDSLGNYTPQQPVQMNFPSATDLETYVSESVAGYESDIKHLDAEMGGIVDELVEAIGIDDEESYSIKQGQALDYNADPEQDAMDAIAQETLDILTGYEITATQIEALYKKMVAKNNSNYDEDAFKDKLSNIALYLNSNYKKNAKLIMGTLQQMAQDIMDTSKEAADPAKEAEAKDIKAKLRKTQVVLTRTQLQDAIHAYGSLQNLRRETSRRIKIASAEEMAKQGITTYSSLDQAWGELCDTLPGLDRDAAEGDMVGNLVEALNALYDPDLVTIRKKYGQGEVDYLAKQMANDMFLNLMSAVTPTDKKDAWNRLRSVYADKLAAHKEMLDKKYSEKLSSLRERYEGRNERTLEAMARQRESVREQAAKRQENAQRSKFKKDARKIYDHLHKMLVNPTDAAYIPVDLVNAVCDVCQEINFDTGFRLADGGETQAFMKLDQMRKDYESMRMGESDYLKPEAGGAMYDARIPIIIDQMKEAFKDGRKINDLTTGELKELVEGLSYIHQSVKRSTELVGKENNKKTYTAAAGIIEDVNKAAGLWKGKIPWNNPVGNFLNTTVDKAGLGANMAVSQFLSPERFARRLVGYRDNSMMNELFDDLTKGEAKMHEIQMDIDKIMSSVMDGRENAKQLKRLTGSKAEWFDYGFKDDSGNPVRITPAMRIALYLHMQNNGNLEHIENGGVLIPNERLYKAGKMSEAYAQGTVVKHISRQTLQNIVKDMTEYEKKFAKVASQVFNDYSKRKINETSLALSGYEKARVSNYFPISTDKDFLNKQFDSLAFDASITSAGQLKGRVRHAKNPIMLEEVTSALQRQQDFVSRYAGLAIPISNFGKVMNVSLVDKLQNDDGSITVEYKDSMKKAIKSKWGTEAMNYIENMVTDLNGARKTSDKTVVNTLLNKTRGNLAAGVLTGNVGVMIKQTASYPVAVATLGYKAVAQALLLDQRGHTSKSRQELIDLIDRYTGEYHYRAKGNSTQELGDLTSQNSVNTALMKVPGVREWLNGIQKFDLATTRLIWKAAEIYVKDNNPDIKVGTDSFYRKVAEMYNKTIHDTQPNYATMQRPELLRTNSEITKVLTMFMTQRLQNGNLMYDSTANMIAKQQMFKADKSAENREALNKAKKEFAATITSQIISAAVIASMTFVQGALKHKINKYRDDEGNVTSESFWEAFIQDTGSSLAGSFLAGSELYDFILKAITGDKYYGISDNLLGNINDFASTAQDIITTNNQYNSGNMTDEKYKEKMSKYMLEMGTYLGQMLGIPFANAKDMIQGTYLHVQDAMKGEFGSFEAGYQRKNQQLYDLYYEAINSGDTAAAEKWHNQLIDAGQSEQQISSNMKKRLKDTDMIAQAAAAAESGDIDEYEKYVAQVTNLGFDKNDVIGAVNSSGSGTEEKSSEAKPKRMYTDDMLGVAVADSDLGKIDEMREDYIASTSAEDPEAEFQKKITKAAKDEYSDDYVNAVLSGNTSEIDKLEKKFDDLGIEPKKYQGWISKETKEQLAEKYGEAFASGNVSQIEKYEGMFDDLGISEKTYTKWGKSDFKKELSDAYLSDDKAKVEKLMAAGEKLGYEQDEMWKWIGSAQVKNVTDNIDSAIGSFSGGSVSYDKAKDAAVQEYEDLIQAKIAKGRSRKQAVNDIRTSLRTHYKGEIYSGMSQEDRNRLQNFLIQYCGFTAKTDFSKWAE